MNDMLREDLLALVSNRTTVSRRDFVAGSLAAGEAWPAGIWILTRATTFFLAMIQPFLRAASLQFGPCSQGRARTRERVGDPGATDNCGAPPPPPAMTK